MSKEALLLHGQTWGVKMLSIVPKLFISLESIHLYETLRHVTAHSKPGCRSQRA